MSITIKARDDLFDAGPPMRWERALGLVKPHQPRTGLRARIVVLVGWVPLAALTVGQIYFSHDQGAKAFFSDIAVYARFLIAAPMLVLAEADCIPRLGRIARHFLDGGFIISADQSRYNDAIRSTRHLLDSRLAEVVAVALAYAAVFGVVYGSSPAAFPVWHRSGAGTLDMTLAGWWHLLVSVPLLLVLIIGWLWRIFLWGRFLLLIERLDLRLIPGHPDRVGGLKFVATSLRGFRLIAFGFGALVAGAVANRVHEGESPLNFKYYALGLTVFILILSAGPLTVFVRMLRAVKGRGIFAYGALAGKLGCQFELKWLKNTEVIEQSALDVPDFSTTTDLYGVVANVYQMKDFTFGVINLVEVVVAALLPFLPIALLVMPLKVILKELVKLLL